MNRRMSCSSSNMRTLLYRFVLRMEKGVCAIERVGGGSWGGRSVRLRGCIWSSEDMILGRRSGRVGVVSW